MEYKSLENDEKCFLGKKQSKLEKGPHHLRGHLLAGTGVPVGYTRVLGRVRVTVLENPRTNFY